MKGWDLICRLFVTLFGIGRLLERRVTRARSLVLPPLKKSERERSGPGD
jgi:hypothetical protein